MKFFFEKIDKKFTNLADAIETLCDGLIYISETDSRVSLFAGTATGEVTKEIILRQIDREVDSPVEEVPFREFFVKLTTHEDWFGDLENERAERFLELQNLLKENLRDLKVFRIGKIRLDIFAVGVDKDGCLMGVTTNAVET